MEIIVEGTATKSIEPDQVIINVNFKTHAKTYDEALNNGLENVNKFIEEIVEKNNINKNKVKTRDILVSEDTIYNNETLSYDKIGFIFNQNLVLKLDYDKNILAKIIKDIQKLIEVPQCIINFAIKDEEKERNKILKDAYKNALKKAKAIASAASKSITACEQVDFKPITENYMSESFFEPKMMSINKMNGNVEKQFLNSFTPKEIEITEKLYCKWTCE